MNSTPSITDTPQDHQRFVFILCTLGFVAAWIITNSFFKTGWISALILSFLVLTVDFVYIIKKEDHFLGKLIIFGLAAGITELLADAWLVDQTKTLFYEHGEPLLVDSPIYMPVAWAVVLVQIGYIGYWISQRKGLLTGTLAAGVIGGVIIPIYESCAKGAGWWYYNDVGHMFWNAPYYIILGEFILALALPYLFVQVRKREFYWAVPLGVLMGLWIWVAYAVGLTLVG
jgi:hypothetical protein